MHFQAFILFNVLLASPICSRSVSKGTVRERDRPIRAYSPRGNPFVRRKDSRRRRLMRFRTTALPSFLPTRMLTRCTGDRRQRRTKEGQTNLIPGDSIRDWIWDLVRGSAFNGKSASDSQAVTTLGATFLDNFFPGSGRHPFAKPVSPGAAKIARIKCQGHEISLYGKWRDRWVSPGNKMESVVWAYPETTSIFSEA